MKLLNKRGLAFLGVIAAANVAAIACGSSEDENQAESGSGAKAFFLEKVHQPLVENCSKCHATGLRGSPVFLSPDGKAAYNAIEGFPGLISAPSLSPLVQKGPHSGPALSSTQADLITQWLKLEVQERNLGSDPGVPKNLRAAFKAFGDCMDYTEWKAKGLDKIATTNTDNNQGACFSCHNKGTGSMWWSLSPEETFLKMREFPYVQRLVIGRVKEDGTFDDIEPSSRILDKGNEAQQQQANNHPRYSLPSEASAALREYVTNTLYRARSGQCTNVTLPDAGADAK